MAVLLAHFKSLRSSGKIHKASKKQINILSLVGIVFEDVPIVYGNKDEINRRALSIVRDLPVCKYRYLNPEIGLTAEHL